MEISGSHVPVPDLRISTTPTSHVWVRDRGWGFVDASVVVPCSIGRLLAFALAEGENGADKLDHRTAV